MKKDGNGQLEMRVPLRYEEFQTLGHWHHLSYAVTGSVSVAATALWQAGRTEPVGTKRRGVVCTLRHAIRSKSLARVNKVRGKVVGWLEKASKTINVPVKIGAVSVTVGKSYMAVMQEAQVVVTANPTHWEGDHRFWEALASGAMVMCDKAYALHLQPHAPKHGAFL